MLGVVAWQFKAEATPCSCTIFGTPTGNSNFSEGSDLELGVKFRASTDGYIKAIRFYKQGSMGGTHTGRLWTSGGSEMGSVVFTGESASGWQEMSFPSPIAVTADTLYVASVSMVDGNYTSTANYFTSNITNGPLTAPSSASVGGNGVFNVNTGSFPSSSFNSANYWIDVSFFDDTAPAVTSTSPLDDATGVDLGNPVTATFDQSMDATTLTSSTFTVKDPENNTVAGSLSYDSASRTASFVASGGFAVNTTYTATIEGGTGTVAKNSIGVALGADATWSFTTDTTDPCPCTLKERVAPTGSTTFDDSGGAELGVKVKPTTNGYITAVRFYKPIISTESTHTARIWSSSGSELASVSFTNESDYGWQEAKLGTPLQVTKDQLYVISYSTSTAVYQATAGGLNSNVGGGYLVAHADNSAQNAATGSGNRNGVFSATAGNYPNQGSTTGTYYWIDAVFATQSAPQYPLTVGVTQPSADALGIAREQVVTATFNRQLDAATVTNSTFRLFDSSNNQVSGVATYDTALGVAKFTPGSALTYGQRYTARISASVADPAGTTLGAEHSWSFTVGSQLATDINQGPGGPLLVITTSGDKYGKYYAEILRAEGLNYFDVKDISAVSATTLANYKAVVLAEMSLSQSQADMLSTWVTGGGNLVAMRPDSKLASLLGLTAAGSTRTNQYLLVNTAAAPGTGVVGETMQFKGTADNYTTNGATTVATFYSDASTSTSNPAVTTRQVGSNGGTAAAFAYDLAKSVIAQHQGNQAWAGQNRDGTLPTRTNDLFFGNMSGDSQPDWVDLNKIHIPQADEQQRLLANVLTEATKDTRPLPRFWYLPGDHKAAMVLAGDDHGLANNVGTERIMNDWLNESSINCSVIDWQCVRASHYFYENSSITNSRALQYHNLSFGIGNHVQSNCQNYLSYAALTTTYNDSLTAWRTKYSSIPNQKSHRFHCYVWSDWDSQMRVDADNGMRYDLNYVAYPQSWINSRSTLMTGSGMNMRFTDADGDMMDVYQGVTNLDDTAANATSIAALLDNAVGSSGYYGIFGTHYDMNTTYEDTLLAAARARNIPTISSEQALAWLDGRNSSAFSNFTGGNGQFGFDITVAVGATNLRAMLPMQDRAGTLSTLTQGGNAVTYQTQTIKGVSYAVFTANPGSYVATYTDYDPNANNGGDSGGESGGSGTGTSGSSSTSGGSSRTAARSPSSAAAETTEQTSTTALPPEETPSGESTPSTPEQNEQPAATPTNQDFSWLWWLLGLLVVGIGIMIIVWRRRHPDTTAM